MSGRLARVATVTLCDGTEVELTEHGVARLERLDELGRSIADYLDANPEAFQEEAAIACGVPLATYWRWLTVEDRPAEEAFQKHVLMAVFRQARAESQRAEQDIALSEGGSGAWANWHKWKLGKRFRKLFGDLAPEGTTVNVQQNNATVVSVDGKSVDEMSDAELEAFVLGRGEQEGK